MRDAVRDFVDHEVKPVALKSARLEAGERDLPPEVVAKAAQLGLRALELSESNGGAGADTLSACIVAEELAVGEINLAAKLMETSAVAHLLFDLAMTPEQRARVLPQFQTDDHYHLAWAYREPDGDYDIGINYHRPAAAMPSFRTNAVKQDNNWVINGRKSQVANGSIAKLFAVQVQISTGVATLLVPADTPGLTVRSSDVPYAWHHGSSADLIFENCCVPATNILAVDSGKSPLAPPGPERSVTQALNLGVGRAAYEAAVEYSKLRVQGARPIIQHQAVGARLADMAIRLHVARTMIWHAAWATDHPEADRGVPGLPDAAIAKVFTSEAMHRVALDAADCFGAPGIMRDLPAHKYVRDALIFLHGAQSNEETRLRIAEAIAGYRRA